MNTTSFFWEIGAIVFVILSPFLIYFSSRQVNKKSHSFLKFFYVLIKYALLAFSFLISLLLMADTKYISEIIQDLKENDL